MSQNKYIYGSKGLALASQASAPTQLQTIQLIGLSHLLRREYVLHGYGCHSKSYERPRPVTDLVFV